MAAACCSLPSSDATDGAPELLAQSVRNGNKRLPPLPSDSDVEYPRRLLLELCESAIALGYQYG